MIEEEMTEQKPITILKYVRKTVESLGVKHDRTTIIGL